MLVREATLHDSIHNSSHTLTAGKKFKYYIKL